ncbi:MAG: VOC family protein [Pseudomonadota bacterium]
MGARGDFAGVALNVLDPEALAKFYVARFGMNAAVVDDEIRLTFGDASDHSSGGRGAYIALRRSPSREPYRHQRSDRYWKIGVTLPNVDLARRLLTEAGVEVSAPRQFRDIGCMCHLSDPQGFQIELLQHSFEGAPRTAEGDASAPLGGGAALGQVTLRTLDIDADRAWCEGEAGMTLLSVQPVTAHGFDLYFLATTEETPPARDLKAVENRPWLWRRPYPVLEFQHLLDGDAALTTAEGSTGFAGLRFSEDQA